MEERGGEARKENINKKSLRRLLRQGCCSLLTEYHVGPFVMPSGAFEPWLCEKSCWRLCAWAVYHNFRQSKQCWTGRKPLFSHSHNFGQLV